MTQSISRAAIEQAAAHITGRTSLQPEVAIVTGSDRGIWFEVCRRLGEMGYPVMLTSPNRIIFPFPPPKDLK